jgi:hypothetical protein
MRRNRQAKALGLFLAASVLGCGGAAVRSRAGDSSCCEEIRTSATSEPEAPEPEALEPEAPEPEVAEGQIYSRSGAPAGRIDSGGYRYDETGAPAGRMDDSGRVYGPTGAPAGRVDDSGYVYDETGAPAGRIDPSCTGECRTNAVHQIFFGEE